ncbi:MAG: DNA repair protein RecN [Acidobacteriaceae bacterium]|jgi:DNA repair protein RecN (Recombination protein N)|nr:DNA repair protein RecN [Acidobacteriaceae bacterium]
MLRFLRIRRLAVIDAVEVEFGPGLNVLTGETGAGKSILVEAVGLLLGGRASADLVRTGEESAVIEALFEHGGEEFLVRREITAQGRSRAYVNGELATATALKQLSTRLIELHGQHEHQTLLDPATHLPLLDAFGCLDTLVESVGRAYDTVTAVRAELIRVRRAVADRDARLDLLQFQWNELTRAALQPGEDEELSAAKRVLSSAERLSRLCAESYALLYEDDPSVLSALAGVWKRISELAAIDPQFQPYIDARDTIKSQLEDLAFFLRQYQEGIEASPARLQQVEDRLALIERLKRKHGPTLADVLARQHALGEELSDLERGDARIDELERQHATLCAAYLAQADALGAARREAATRFARSLERAVFELSLDARVEVRLETARDEEAWTPAGIDRGELYLSTNQGEDLRPLARIASGGELSRLMLAVKTITSSARRQLSDEPAREPGLESPGLIFDEVDAGIGGRVAESIGRKLRALGSQSQVLCITHLPQIAAAADTHFLIEKRVEQGRTRTTVSRLVEDARIEEVSRMLAGSAVTDSVRRSARELLAAGVADIGIVEANAASEAKGEIKTKGESESRKIAKAKAERRTS